MTPGQLVKAVSIALEVPEETVVQHDRNLVVAGLRTKGGRGRSAPQVTPLDAARLLVATLASFRTKDSVTTVEQFEHAIFEPPDKPRYFSVGGIRLRDKPDPDGAKRIDSAILDLPTTHNLVDGLAAIIRDASRPIDNFQSFLNRFGKLGVSCSSPSGNARIGEVTFVGYSVPREILADVPRESWEDRQHSTPGIRQDRMVSGTAIMLLGAAFRDNGLRYASAYEAYLAGYGTKNQKPHLPKSGKRGGA
jgi:hypothetical protein